MTVVFLSSKATKKIIKIEVIKTSKAVILVTKNHSSAFSDKYLKLNAELSKEKERNAKLNTFNLKILTKRGFVSVER